MSPDSHLREVDLEEMEMGRKTNDTTGKRRSNQHISGIPDGGSGANRKEMTFKGFRKKNRSHIEIKISPCLDTHAWTLKIKIILKAAREKGQTTDNGMKESQLTFQ